MLDKHYNPQTTEKQIYDQWEKSKAFADGNKVTGEPYCIIMPPANVTGSLHLGHALTFTIQDILVRHERMQGKHVLWQAGTDHAGIATQMVVERQLAEKGIDRHQLGRTAFLEKVWAWKSVSGGAITQQLKRLGASADWSRERFTMDEASNHAVTKAFVSLYEQGLIYRDKRLVNWDPKLQTAISDLEVIQKEEPGYLWHIKYILKNDSASHIVVATTRPETLFGDAAVAVHPDDERYKDFIGQEVLLPLCDRTIPIIADEYCDQEKGTGAVKITPAHDFNDFEVGKRHDLPLMNILDENCHLNDAVPSAYQGLCCEAAREKVLAALKEAGQLVQAEEIQHTVPYGDRSQVVIEPYLTDQWYVDAATLAKPAIEAVEKGETTFVPANWDKTYFEWMRNIQPWCISRQIWWGHQVPAWYGPDGEIFVAETVEEALEKAKQHYGKPVELTRDSDVLDTWFSSGLWPFSTLGWPEKTDELATFYPTNVLVTGFDIIFFWVARMMMMGLHFTGKVPFKTVYIHALVRDKEGNKMSKTKGNVIDPMVLIENYGADALRFTLASLASPGRDIKISEDRVEGGRNFSTKLWNATRYILMNESHWDASFDPTQCRLPVNQWLVYEMSHLAQSLQEAYQNYRLNDIAGALYQFTWKTFCDWYVEITKPLLQEGTVEEKIETQRMLAWGMGTLCHFLHPVMPHITETLWHALGGEGQLITAAWPNIDAPNAFRHSAGTLNNLIDLISEIRSLRAEMNISPGAYIDLYGEVEATSYANIQQQATILKRLARLQNLQTHVPSDPHFMKQAIQLVVNQTTFYIPIGDVIDVAAEKARLEKAMAKLTKDITSLEARLNNDDFIARAPESVIAAQKEKRADFKASYDKLHQAAKRLAGLKV